MLNNGSQAHVEIYTAQVDEYARPTEESIAAVTGWLAENKTKAATISPSGDLLEFSISRLYTSRERHDEPPHARVEHPRGAAELRARGDADVPPGAPRHAATPATQRTNRLGVTGFLDHVAGSNDGVQMFLFRPDNLDIQYAVGLTTGVPVVFYTFGTSNPDGVDAISAHAPDTRLNTIRQAAPSTSATCRRSTTCIPMFPSSCPSSRRRRRASPSPPPSPPDGSATSSAPRTTNTYTGRGFPDVSFQGGNAAVVALLNDRRRVEERARVFEPGAAGRAALNDVKTGSNPECGTKCARRFCVASRAPIQPPRSHYTGSISYLAHGTPNFAKLQAAVGL
ncbi:family S53 protease [Mycena pura]|uniref:Family S53 protease n=1 Tax=Mycena pura TaxID=153505 RepID=A0AAD6UZF6_9AGAR|nr:family S53 protease [Mycena pura]